MPRCQPQLRVGGSVCWGADSEDIPHDSAREIWRHMVQKTVIVTNPLGIHARPATLLVQSAARFEADIFLSKGDIQRINGKSIMGVMMLAAEQGAEILIEAEGADAQAAMEACAELLASSFEERF